jgi:hypothetical protein
MRNIDRIKIKIGQGLYLRDQQFFKNHNYNKKWINDNKSILGKFLIINRINSDEETFKFEEDFSEALWHISECIMSKQELKIKLLLKIL